MVVHLRSRLMFCHGPRRFSLLAPCDEHGRILAPTRRITQTLKKTDTDDLLQRLPAPFRGLVEDPPLPPLKPPTTTHYNEKRRSSCEIMLDTIKCSRTGRFLDCSLAEASGGDGVGGEGRGGSGKVSSDCLSVTLPSCKSACDTC